MSDREFVVSTRFYLNSFDFTQFNLNKGTFFLFLLDDHRIPFHLKPYICSFFYDTENFLG